MDLQRQQVLSSNPSSAISTYVSYHYVANCTQTQQTKKITFITSQLHVGKESGPGSLTDCPQVSKSGFQVRHLPGNMFPKPCM